MQYRHYIGLFLILLICAVMCNHPARLYDDQTREIQEQELISKQLQEVCFLSIYINVFVFLFSFNFLIYFFFFFFFFFLIAFNVSL